MTKGMLFELEFRGTTIGFHWSIVLTLANGLLLIRSPLYAIIAFLTSLLIVIVHEIGHAAFCKALRYEVHCLVVQFMGGYCEHEEVDYRREQVLIAMGGVAFQAVLLVVALTLVLIIGPNRLVLPLRYLLLDELIYYNLFIIILNLVPLAGFDGHELLSYVQFSSPTAKGSRKIESSLPVKPRIRYPGAIGQKTTEKAITRDEAKQIVKKMMSKIEADRHE